MDHNKLPLFSRPGWFSALQIAGWGTLFVLLALLNSRYNDFGSLTAMAWVCSSGGIITTLWHRFFKARRWNRHGNDWRLPAMALLVVGPIQAASSDIASSLFLHKRGLLVDHFSTELAIWCTVMLVWTICYMAAVALRRAARLEAEALHFEILAKDAELRALQSQVNPHFFFNSLNSVRALMFVDVNNAADMVDRLATLMRYTLTSTFSDCVPLQQELDAVRSYLAIEKIRFEERLRMHFEIEPGLAQVTLPPMTLQTLVENAVKYGVERRTDGSEIRIVARQAGDCAMIEVANQGSLLANSSSTRVGISNARKRLVLAKGEQASLHLSERDGWVRATLSFPLAA